MSARDMKVGWYCFGAAFGLFLLFDAWGGLHIPNPFAWHESERKFALWIAITAGATGALFSSMRSDRK